MSRHQFSIGILFGIIIYTLLFWGITRLFFSNMLRKDQKLNQYFNLGFFLKIGMGITFALLYEFYYKWMGDTFYYFSNSCRMANTLWHYPSSYFKMLFDLVNEQNFAYFKVYSYNPLAYKGNASGLYNIHRFLSPFAIIGLNNYYLMTIVQNSFLYIFNFKVFKFILDNISHSKYQNITFFAILCVPSALLFSSGLMKDSFCFTFSSLMIVYLYRMFFNNKFTISNILKILFCFYIVYSLKPYLLFVFVGSFFLWYGFSYLHRVKNKILRIFIFPAAMFLVVVGLIYGSRFLGTKIGGKYSNINTMVSAASASQMDLKQDYYQGNSFDIGDYDDLDGMISLSPAAILAGLYRPFIWETRSAGMLFSGLENLLLSVLSLYAIFIIRPKRLLIMIKNNLFLLFCLAVSIFLAFSIGITTSNFGALVRFKIPMLPFLFYALLMFRQEYKMEIEKK